MSSAMDGVGAKGAGRWANRLFAVLVLAIASVYWLAGSPAAAKYASIVIDGHSGQVLYAANAETRNYPASLTKMMTLYLLFEALDEGKLSKSSRLKVSSHAARQPPSKLGLRAGQTIKVEDAIKAIVIRSANDVAVVVGEAIGGTEAKFAKMMTAKARQIGMSRTTFANASGLPNRRQLSTAHDMARLAQALYFTFPHYYHYFDLNSFRYGNRTYRTHNNVARTYPGADGLKTGYTRASGYNLVTTAERNGRRLVGVVFGGRSSRSRDAHMVSLLNKAWPKLNTAEVLVPEIKPDVLVAEVSAPKATPVSAALPTPEIVTASLPMPKLPAGNAIGPVPPAVPTPRPGDIPPTVDLAPTPKPGIVMASISQPATEARPSSDRGLGAWAIQVGAYYDRDGAARAVDRAKSKMPSLSETADEAIVLLKGRKRPIYRARLVGFSEQDARNACRQLKKERVPCIAVKQTKDAILAYAQ